MDSQNGSDIRPHFERVAIVRCGFMKWFMISDRGTTGRWVYS